MKKILVTGGAGFIGSHIVDQLVAEGHDVTIFDNLDPQVHGPEQKIPEYLNKDAEFIQGDVRNAEELKKAMLGKEIVFHEAAAVGVGQSMYEISRYTEYNSLGGAVLLDLVINTPALRDKIEKLIVASSMSIYGEGRYKCAQCGLIAPKLRPDEQMKRKDWEVHCPHCSKTAEALATDEDKPLFPTSIYAVTKRDHEEMFLSVGRSYKIPTVALRYFNVYGPRQALSNPYTGVAAIFSSRILNDNPPVIYEDGRQSRDFVHVGDIAQANILAMEKPTADYEVFNVGTGRNLTIEEVGRLLIKKLKPGKLEPVIAQKYREGDIRHCYADISKIKEKLGYEPGTRFEDGLEELTGWVAQQSAEDGFEKAKEELEKRGLTR